MSQSMSLAARREMLFSIRQRYLCARRPEKSKILDGFVAATGYDRKYALVLLRKKHAIIDSLSSNNGAENTTMNDLRKHSMV